MSSPMSVPALKAEIRRTALDRRAAIGPAARAAAALAIRARGLEIARRVSEKSAALYLPMREELDCLPLLDALATAGWRTALPCTPARGEALTFRRWGSGEALAPARFGTREPSPDSPLAVPAVVFAPLAAFDRAGGRIGYGGGYYDATMAALAASGRRPLYVGLAFAAQEVAEIPAEPHDARLDFVLTENEAISCAGA